MQSPYERFQALEAKRAREEPLSYCYARTREEHEPYFKGKDITQLKRWLENIRKNYDKLVDPVQGFIGPPDERERSEEHPSELQSLMRISYAVFCLTHKLLYTL